MNRTLTQWLAQELRSFLQPLELAVESPSHRQRLFWTLGWDLDIMPGFDLAAWLQTTVATVVEVQQLLTDLEAAERLEDLLPVLGRIGDLFESIRALIDDTHLQNVPFAHLNQLGPRLLRFLLLDYLKRSQIGATILFHLLGLIRLPSGPDSSDPTPGGGLFHNNQQVGQRVSLPEIRFDRLGDLFTDPVGFLRNHFGLNGLTGLSAGALRARLGPVMAMLSTSLGALGWQVRIIHQPVRILPDGFPPDVLPLTAMVRAQMIFRSKIVEREVPIGLAGQNETVHTTGEAKSYFRISIMPVRMGNGDFGLYLDPHLHFDDPPAADVLAEFLRRGFKLDWAHVNVDLKAQSSPFIIHGGGVTLIGDQAGPRIFASFALTHRPPRGPEGTERSALLLGDPNGTHLRIGQLGFEAFADVVRDHADFGFALKAGEGRLAVAAPTGDSFLASLIPEQGLGLDFDLGLGWSRSRGFYLEGGAGLAATIPIYRSLLGVLEIETLHLELGVRDGKLSSDVSATFSSHLGPLDLTVERMGLNLFAALARDTQAPGNIAGLGFKPPAGVGISIDTGAVRGGGFLQFDADNHRYAGAIQLEFAGIALNTIGLLTTRLPDGRSFAKPDAAIPGTG